MKPKKHMKRINEAILDPLLAVSPAMVRAMRGCLSPSAVAYYLRANPDIAEKISRMGEDRTEREIDAIADAFDRVDDRIAEVIDAQPDSFWPY